METDATTMNGSSAGSDTAKATVSSTLSDAMETARAKTGNMQAGLADLLDSSAQVIRSRGAAAGDVTGTAVGDGAARVQPDGRGCSDHCDHRGRGGSLE